MTNDLLVRCGDNCALVGWCLDPDASIRFFSASKQQIQRIQYCDGKAFDLITLVGQVRRGHRRYFPLFQYSIIACIVDSRYRVVGKIETY